MGARAAMNGTWASDRAMRQGMQLSGATPSQMQLPMQALGASPLQPPAAPTPTVRLISDPGDATAVQSDASRRQLSSACRLTAPAQLRSPDRPGQAWLAA